MCLSVCQRMPQHLENMFDALGVIQVGVNQEFKRVILAKESELQIAVILERLEAVSSHISGRRIVQLSRDFVKEAGEDAVLDFIAQRRADLGKEAVSAHPGERRYKRRYCAPGGKGRSAHLGEDVQQSGLTYVVERVIELGALFAIEALDMRILQQLL